jgi:hypothetical protein
MPTYPSFVFVLILSISRQASAAFQSRQGRTLVAMINLDKHSDHVVLVGRLFYSSLFILYGYFKLIGFAGTAAYMGK